jgi:hypothetical protein
MSDDSGRGYANYQRLSAATAAKYRRDPLADDRQPDEPPPAPERKLDTAPIDWAAVIDERIAADRQFTLDVLAEVIAEIQAQATDDLERATRLLTAELADLKATLAELRLTMASDKSVPLDLPPLRRALN